MKGDVLYCSRSPIPYNALSSKLFIPRRVLGIFGFRWGFLKLFNKLSETSLEWIESCDSNRLCDHGYTCRIAPIDYEPVFSVDRPEDLLKVEQYLLFTNSGIRENEEV